MKKAKHVKIDGRWQKVTIAPRTYAPRNPLDEIAPQAQTQEAWLAGRVLDWDGRENKTPCCPQPDWFYWGAARDYRSECFNCGAFHYNEE